MSGAEPGPLSLAERQRVQRIFDQAWRMSEAGQHAGAHERFAASLELDPGNLVFIDATLANLDRWQRSPDAPRRRGGWLATRGLRGAVRAERWLEVQRRALDLLVGEPRQPLALECWGGACLAWRQYQAALVVLARLPEPRSLEPTRLAALALTRLGRFDAAIVEWRRVRELAPQERAAESYLSAMIEPNPTPDPNPTRQRGASTSHPAPGGWATGPDSSTTSERLDTPGASLARRAEIRPEASPAEASDRVAQIVAEARRAEDAGDFVAARATLREGLAALGDLRLLEEDERLQLEYAARQDRIAQRLVAAQLDDELTRVAAELAELRRRLELEIYDLRSQRRPDEPRWHWEVGLRLADDRNWEAAIERLACVAAGEFQARAALLRGECSQRLRRFEQAAECYRACLACCDDEDLRGRATARLAALGAS